MFKTELVSLPIRIYPRRTFSNVAKYFCPRNHAEMKITRGCCHALSFDRTVKLSRMIFHAIRYSSAARAFLNSLHTASAVGHEYESQVQSYAKCKIIVAR